MCVCGGGGGEGGVGNRKLFFLISPRKLVLWVFGKALLMSTKTQLSFTENIQQFLVAKLP